MYTTALNKQDHCDRSIRQFSISTTNGKRKKAQNDLSEKWNDLLQFKWNKHLAKNSQTHNDDIRCAFESATSWQAGENRFGYLIIFSFRCDPDTCQCTLRSVLNCFFLLSPSNLTHYIINYRCYLQRNVRHEKLLMYLLNNI